MAIISFIKTAWADRFFRYSFIFFLLSFTVYLLRAAVYLAFSI